MPTLMTKQATETTYEVAGSNAVVKYEHCDEDGDTVTVVAQGSMLQMVPEEWASVAVAILAAIDNSVVVPMPEKINRPVKTKGAGRGKAKGQGKARSRNRRSR